MSMSMETPAFETLALERADDHVTIVRLNRPNASNALNTQMGRDLVRYFEDIALDPKDLRCVVLTGSGDKAFCAGGDLKERRRSLDPPARRLRADGAGADRLPGPGHRSR
jgi:enoyl-CoA hydratase/carnithine racemase